MAIGKNIKQLRNSNRNTQTELCKKLGVSDKTISSWEVERTEPNMGQINAMADIFGCEVSDLVGESEVENYYIDVETRRIAQEIKDNPDLRILFDASRNVSKEDMEIVKNLVLTLKKKEKGED